MRQRIYSLLGREFVELLGAAQPAASVEEETRVLFQRFEATLKQQALSLENTVRIRIWSRDRDARNRATAERSKILTGNARACSSSYISPDHFDSDARVALDLLAMRPSRPDAERRPVDFEPPRNYLCYLRYDSLIFCSGFTSDAGTLEGQVEEILKAIAGALAVAGTSLSKAIKLSLFLQRSQKLETLKQLLAQGPKLEVPLVEFGFVDGYAGEKSLLEVEATAVVGG
ncbi:MAG: hypothetical protein HY695_34025 [Deltaproteobacteria bacterium]|nr:hypothetical protein [Deltaproteobacteria bacterium]